MNNILIKAGQVLIITLIFCSLVLVQDMSMRQAQEMIMALMIVVIFGLLLRNIWLTMFLWWTVFVFMYYKFSIGGNYVINVTLGCMLYYCVKAFFKKKDIDLYINGFLCLIALSAGYMVLQTVGFDFLYKTALRIDGELKGYLDVVDPAAFYGFLPMMGVVMALAVPVMASRPHRFAIPASLCLFAPLYLSKSSISVAGGVIGLLFVMWYRVGKRLWISCVLLLSFLAVIYVWKVDYPMGTLYTRLDQWKQTLTDSKIHPITGWGLDSFRSTTPWKKHIYVMNYKQVTPDKANFDFWDNAHNLYIQLVFEYGLVGLLILCGYLWQYHKWFKNAVKEPNTLAVAGFMLVLIIVNMAQFPMFLSRSACFIIPMAALGEVQMRT